MENHSPLANTLQYAFSRVSRKSYHSKAKTIPGCALLRFMNIRSKQRKMGEKTNQLPLPLSPPTHMRRPNFKQNDTLSWRRKCARRRRRRSCTTLLIVEYFPDYVPALAYTVYILFQCIYSRRATHKS